MNQMILYFKNKQKHIKSTVKLFKLLSTEKLFKYTKSKVLYFKKSLLIVHDKFLTIIFNFLKTS